MLKRKACDELISRKKLRRRERIKNGNIDKYKPETVYKLIGGRNGKVGVKETLPHYMVMFI